MRDPDTRPPFDGRSASFDEEQSWVARIRAGDEAAFKALYDRYSERMFAYGLASLGSPAEAEDLVHDVFLAILKQGQRWEVDGELRTYLMRAMHNRIVTRRRHLRVELTSHESIVRDAGTPSEWTHRGRSDDALHEHELAAALARAVASLAPRAQQAYRLVREMHLSHSAAAEVMGITVHTVEIHLVRALAAVREQLSSWRKSGG